MTFIDGRWEGPVAAILADQVGAIMLTAVFLLIGLAICALA